ncbi:acyl-CoA dehydrogenase family protein [Pseudoxanthobacter sp.]|uniref:acyl-CoA dehydrogenase family protein n=1 Tax=Pseudoxanthobacter sp. TaxID=1925742 RepID=UPI002FE22C69
MLSYRAPLRDMQFVIEEWLAAPQGWAAIPALAECDAEMAGHVLAEAAKFAENVLSPLNGPGDAGGARLQDGAVTTPPGFAAAYAAYVDGGWPTLAFAPQWGGQGLPHLLDVAFGEMLYAANHGWAMYSGLTQGAYRCLEAYADEGLRARFLPKIASGEWLATMCLTEPQAGSDLNLLRTQAVPAAAGEGRFLITGNKIFISGGEQDLTANIVHLVLARLPDAPAGTRGLSLFVVPKLIDGDDGPPRRNAVHCDSIEHKMGIRASATCAMRFEAAEGWLVGAPNGGLAAMFVMMNAARLHVGLQGLGHATRAFQLAAAYAAERRQARAPGSAAPRGAADPIARHPAVRRILMRLKALSEGERMIGYWAGDLLDRADHGGDRQAAQLLGLLTPVIKAFFTDTGFQAASSALQVFGGYGYVAEYAIEQTLRDSRIAMIYEGTNEVQAIDFTVRKTLADGGAGLETLLAVIDGEAALAGAVPAAAQAGALLSAATARVRAAMHDLVAEAAGDAERGFRAADDFLRANAWLLLAFAWTRALRLCAGRAAADDFCRAKVETAGFFLTHLAPEIDHCLALVAASRHALPELAEP